MIIEVGKTYIEQHLGSRYTKIQFIGRGASGYVYRAKVIGSDEEYVAIKVGRSIQIDNTLS